MQLPGLQRLSRKRILIDKANSAVLVILVVASMIVAISLVLIQSMLKQNSYQQQVIKERKAAKKQLQDNVTAAKRLADSYRSFQSDATSVLGTSDTNAKVVLDALPSKYDFPAIATSLEKILTDGGFVIDAIAGSDQEASAEQNSAAPVPIAIPFEINVRTNYDSVKKLIADFDRSIRPIAVNQLEITAGEDSIRLKVAATTYYQPQKNLEVQSKVVK